MRGEDRITGAYLRWGLTQGPGPRSKQAEGVTFFAPRHPPLDQLHSVSGGITTFSLLKGQECQALREVCGENVIYPKDLPLSRSCKHGEMEGIVQVAPGVLRQEHAAFACGEKPWGLGCWVFSA